MDNLHMEIPEFDPITYSTNEAYEDSYIDEVTHICLYLIVALFLI